MRSKVMKIFGIFALMVMVAYQGAIHHYSHIHIVNGVVITHMHGFAPGEKQTHEHSADDFAKIDVLFHFIVATLSVALTLFLISSLLREIFTCRYSCASIEELRKTSLRGPPALV